MPVFRIPRQHIFPHPALAETEPNGLLGVGGDLSPGRLLLAYRSGIFPWYSQGEPILWWSPDPRMVLYPGEVHVPRSLARVFRRCVIRPGCPDESGDAPRQSEAFPETKASFTLTLDEAFADVIHLCAGTPRPGQPGTWITPEMEAAYRRLHQLGHAHSCEAWLGRRLAGGVYGVAIGRFFSAESMFYRVPDASKVALVCLVRQLARWDFRLIDTQLHTPNVARFGGRLIPRPQYLTELASASALPGKPGPWEFDA